MPIPVVVLNHRNLAVVANEAAEEFFCLEGLEGLGGLPLSRLGVEACPGGDGRPEGPAVEEFLTICRSKERMPLPASRRFSGDTMAVCLSVPSDTGTPVKYQATMSAKTWQPDRAAPHVILAFSDIRDCGSMDVTCDRGDNSRECRSPDDCNETRSSGISNAEKIKVMTAAIVTQSEVPMVVMWKDKSIIIANPGMQDHFPVANLVNICQPPVPMRRETRCPPQAGLATKM
jgi:hypothetical protein